MFKSHRGFSLIEMMVIITIIGLVITAVAPRLLRRPPSAEWPIVLDDINNLVYFARQEAISYQKIHRLRFKLSGKEGTFVTVESAEDDPEKPGKKKFETVSSGYFSTKYKLSEFIHLDNIFHGKRDEFTENNFEAYCYVVPNGLVQDTVIRLTRNYESHESKVSFRMKPFLGKFEMLDGHIKPEK